TVVMLNATGLAVAGHAAAVDVDDREVAMVLAERGRSPVGADGAAAGVDDAAARQGVEAVGLRGECSLRQDMARPVSRSRRAAFYHVVGPLRSIGLNKIWILICSLEVPVHVEKEVGAAGAAGRHVALDGDLAAGAQRDDGVVGTDDARAEVDRAGQRSGHSRRID